MLARDTGHILLYVRTVMNYKDTNSMNKLLIAFCAIITFLSCKEQGKTPLEIKNQEVDLEVVRFDKKFSNAQAGDIPALKAAFPYLFSSRFPDAYWVQKLQDTIQLEINAEVAKAFDDFEEEQLALTNLFKHITYYFPTTSVPKVITIASDPDYRNKVVLADSLLLIGLSTYLGPEHHFYAGIAQFQAKNFKRAQIDVDVAAAFAKAHTSRPKNKEFLSKMIYEGKQLYAMQTLMTAEPEYETLGYTDDELKFARENEKNIWEFFIKNELLYSTDRKLLSRFIDPAPFSKFYLEFDNETPGQIGRYIGYEIVKSYMDTNDVALKMMLNQDAATIFAAAKYKP